MIEPLNYVHCVSFDVSSVSSSSDSSALFFGIAEKNRGLGPVQTLFEHPLEFHAWSQLIIFSMWW